MDPATIRRIKAAAALRDKTASMVLEEAAKEWLERNPVQEEVGPQGSARSAGSA
ncbi:hypothetical protein [Bradyrhizobium sp. McL0615]|uniref:hypothetical protein n=1 Tax=Bradyrhizobium sp. McL0615 TaxID=3415673 RepID=UPI003CE95900